LSAGTPAARAVYWNVTKLRMNLLRLALLGLLAGGAAQPELFGPAANAFDRVHGRLDMARLFAAAVRLPGGQVLVTGGYGAGAAETNRAWMYTP